MSNATKCDRCGGFYEQGGKNVRQGWGNNSDEYDLCPDCVRALKKWMEYHPVTDAPERVTKTPEMSHDTREQLERDLQTHLYEFGGYCFNSREGHTDNVDTFFDDFVFLLDRQAAITEREFFETACHGCERLGGDDDDTLGELRAERDELVQRIQALQCEIATMKEHRAGNMETLRMLTDANAEMAWRIQQLEKEVSR